MTILEAIGLGALQGVTEFLPVSSSGHLVIGQHLLGITLPGNAFEIWVHLGTLLSIVFVFNKEIINMLTSIGNPETRKYIGILITGTIPAVFVGFGFKETISEFFDSVHIVSLGLMITASVLFLTGMIRKRSVQITLLSGLVIGMAQALAIVPGISRSGTTIAMALVLGASSKEAAKFSFFLAIPVIAGAGLFTAMDTVQNQVISLDSSIIFAGLLTSFLVGWVSLKWLLAILQKGKFHWFGMYCFIVGLILAFS